MISVEKHKSDFLAYFGPAAGERGMELGTDSAWSVPGRAPCLWTHEDGESRGSNLEPRTVEVGTDL